MAKTSCINDPAFLSDFRAGRESAFDTLFREFFSPLSYFSFQFTKDRNAAEDIVQDCFVYVWEHRVQFIQVTAIKAYLFTIVKNNSFKAIRHLKPTAELIEIPAEERNAEQYLISADTAREIIALVQSLPPRVQEVMKLYFLEEKSNRDIAQILQISSDSVTRQKLRGIMALRKAAISQ